MRHILNLFGRSPFTPLQGHMEKVAGCVHELVPLFQALRDGNYPLLQKIADQISKLEHAADITKNDIRNNLPKNLFLSIDRGNFLEMLSVQDSIADAIEDIAFLLTLRQLELPKGIEAPLAAFIDKNIEAFVGAKKVIDELRDLLESTFGGIEADRVRKMVDDISFKEHEADVIQRNLLQSLYAIENSLSYSLFYQWQKIFARIGAISNQAERLADCVRMTLYVK